MTKETFKIVPPFVYEVLSDTKEELRIELVTTRSQRS